MKELRPLADVLEEVKATFTEVARFPMYQHPFFHGFSLPWRDNIPDEMQDKFPITMESTITNAISAWNEAVCEGDYYAAIMIVTPRPFRLHRFLEWDRQMKWEHDGDRIELIRDLWIDCESPHVNVDIWRNLWLEVKKHKHWQDAHTVKELDIFEQWDEPKTLYRGTRGAENQRLGLSWTSDRERAEWFARRWQSAPGTARVLVTEAMPDDMIGPFLQRGEDEYIMLYPERHTYVEKLLNED